VEEGRYGLGKIDLLVLRLAQSLLLWWYLPVVCLLGRWNTLSVQLGCPSHLPLPPGLRVLWGKAIVKGGFEYLQVLSGGPPFIHGAGVGAGPNVRSSLSGEAPPRDPYRWVRM